MSFNPPTYAYGDFGRIVYFTVVDRKDPEQSGRLKVRAIGYQGDEGGISNEDLPWARVAGSPMDPRNGGISAPITGAMENTVMMGYYAHGSQQPILTGTVPPKAGKDQKGEGQLDQKGRNADLNPHSRDRDTHGGGDYRFDRKANNFTQKSIVEYGKKESDNPYKRKTLKDGDPDPEKSRAIEYRYA